HAKLGLSPTEAHHDPLVDELVDLMTAAGADHTLTFRALADMLRGEDAALHTMFHGHGIGAWVERWRDDLAASGLDPAASATAMDAINPLYIPRNHLVEEALSAATAGDLEPFRQLLIRVTNPFVEQAGANRYAEPAPAGFDASYRTFCGT
ncbi:MAG: YdiU family protein, partial [Acidimicrobiales bacterium]|nr:YdiU family protein [Acidimicrobiales bacterium]